jgi:nucleoside-diphosphate-sugar epimerase
MDHERSPNAPREVLYRVRARPHGERLRATPSVAAERLGTGSAAGTVLALARRVPPYLRRGSRPLDRGAAVVPSAVEPGSGSQRVLVTGSDGPVGRRLAVALEARGHRVVRFDRAAGQDVRDPRQTAAAVRGCDAVVHLATVPWNGSWRSSLTVNVWGTAHLLRAARRAGVGRVAYVSTLQVTGAFMGRRPPVRLPFDEGHPTRPETPYAVTKLWAERLLTRAARRDRGLAAVSVRPPAIWEDERFAHDRARWEADETRQWRPFWEYGAFIDIRDLVDLLVRAVEEDLAPGHEVLTVAGPDSASRWPTWDLVQRLHPDVPWRSGRDREAVRAEPFHPRVDSTRAEVVLGWRPRHRFHGREATSGRTARG